MVGESLTVSSCYREREMRPVRGGFWYQYKGDDSVLCAGAGNPGVGGRRGVAPGRIPRRVTHAAGGLPSSGTTGVRAGGIYSTGFQHIGDERSGGRGWTGIAG